jgi:hypothetical protein
VTLITEKQRVWMRALGRGQGVSLLLPDGAPKIVMRGAGGQRPLPRT